MAEVGTDARRVPDAAEATGPVRTSGWGIAIVVALIALAVFLQHAGQLVHDTRLDVALDPWTFMSRTWHLWEPFADMGRVQNQAVGYLFPMGPFYGLAHTLHIPVWIAQRAWLSGLLGLAVWGTARVLDELEIGTPTSRLVAAVSYALCPVFVARTGMLSDFVLGAAFLPWVMVPLIRATKGGSVRRRACWSGLAVFAMGGINGTVVAAVLVVPLLYLLTRARGARRGALLRWWVVAVVLATSWWTIPLLFQGRYGIDFLGLTEQAKTTTAYSSPVEVIRGTADWLSYYHLHGAFLPAGFILAYNGLAILATALVAAAGLFGLARRDLPERRFVVATFLLGVAVVGIGFGGLLGNPFAHGVDHLLDGFLASLRTVYKFAPVVSFPLAIGLAHGLAAATAAVRDRRPSAARALPVLAAVVVVLGALPIFTNDLLNNRPFTKVPAWWGETEHYLGQVPGRTLLVPGLPFSDSTWGFTAEEPLQWGSSSEWATRSIVPLGSTGSTRYLDAVEAAVERGGDPGLVAFLTRGGFTTVTVRNDGLWRKYNAPSPQAVNQALLDSGMKQVASFGPSMPLNPIAGTPQLPLKQIEVYAVDGATRVQSYPVDEAAIASGDPGTALALEQLGLGGRALVLAQDYVAGQPLPPDWINTDGNQRRVVQFGLNRDNGSFVLSTNDGSPNNQPTEQPVAQGLDAGSTNQNQVAVVGTTVPNTGYPGDKVQDQTVAVRTGLLRVSASSSGSWLYSIPEAAPARALDGDPATAWTSGPTTNSSAGQWLQVELSNPVDLSSLHVQLLQDGPWRPEVHSMRVITANGTRITKVKSDESLQTLDVAPGTTSWVRVSFESVTNQEKVSAGAGIRELQIPGVTVKSWLKLPAQLTSHFSDPSTNPPSYVFNRLRTNPHSLLRRSEETTMARLFATPRATTLQVVATASGVPGQAMLDLLDNTKTFQISASSTLGNLPEYAPRNLVDGDGKSVWIAAAIAAADEGTSNGTGKDVTINPSTSDTHPTVTMSWSGVRKLDSLKVVDANGYSKPTSVEIVGNGDTRDATIGRDGVATFSPLATDKVTISFPDVSLVFASDPLGNSTVRPLGLSTLEFPALHDVQPGPVDRGQALVVACSAGPVAAVNGEPRSFSIRTTMGGLISMQPIGVEPCGGADVTLPAGQNTLETSMGTSPFDLDTIGLIAPAMLDTPLKDPRAVTIEKWSDTSRRVGIAAGDQAYLVVNESFSKAWQASLDGKKLQAVRIDGWRQAFVVPSGNGGTVKLEFTPARPYQVGLIFGFLLVVVLLVLALLRAGTGPEPEPVPEGVWPDWLLDLTVVVAAILVGGLAAILVVPFWFLWQRRRDLAPVLAAGSFALAGLYVALTQHQHRSAWQGAFSYPANLLALASFMIVVSTFLPSRRPKPEPASAAEEQPAPST
jgi:arabinofuranan 3-O-arabinosyltransferase